MRAVCSQTWALKHQRVWIHSKLNGVLPSLKRSKPQEQDYNIVTRETVLVQEYYQLLHDKEGVLVLLTRVTICHFIPPKPWQGGIKRQIVMRVNKTNTPRHYWSGVTILSHDKQPLKSSNIAKPWTWLDLWHFFFVYIYGVTSHCTTCSPANEQPGIWSHDQKHMNWTNQRAAFFPRFRM